MTSVATAPVASVSTRPGQGVGLAFALASAAAFGTSGSLARSLLDTGWSPTAVVGVRIVGAFLVLLVPCLLLLRRTGLPTTRQGWHAVAYGVVAVGGAQLCYFSAVQRLSVGVALLLEYTAPVLLIFWHWARSGRRPATPVFAGAVLSLAGLALVLDLTHGFRLDPVGVLWGLAAAVCLCGYFVLAEGSDSELSPLMLTTIGTGVGGAAILAVGALGVLPLAGNTAAAQLAGATVPWWLPLLLLIGVAAVLSYLTGIVSVRMLGSGVASFVSLSEVIFAVAFAAVLVGQSLTPGQLLGGLLVLAGIVVVQRSSARAL